MLNGKVRPIRYFTKYATNYYIRGSYRQTEEFKSNPNSDFLAPLFERVQNFDDAEAALVRKKEAILQQKIKDAAKKAKLTAKRREKAAKKRHLILQKKEC